MADGLMADGTVGGGPPRGWHAAPAHRLDAALRRAAPRLAPAVAAGARVAHHPGDAWTDPGYVLDRAGWWVDGVSVGLAMRWRPADLLDPDGVTWPYVGIIVEGGGPRRREVEQRLPAEVRAEAAVLGWDLSDHGWPWWRWVRPDTDAAGDDRLAAQAVAAQAVAALLAGWVTLAGPLDSFARRRRA